MDARVYVRAGVPKRGRRLPKKKNTGGVQEIFAGKLKRGGSKTRGHGEKIFWRGGRGAKAGGGLYGGRRRKKGISDSHTYYYTRNILLREGSNPSAGGQPLKKKNPPKPMDSNFFLSHASGGCVKGAYSWQNYWSKM